MSSIAGFLLKRVLFLTFLTVALGIFLCVLQYYAVSMTQTVVRIDRESWLSLAEVYIEQQGSETGRRGAEGNEEQREENGGRREDSGGNGGGDGHLQEGGGGRGEDGGEGDGRGVEGGDREGGGGGRSHGGGGDHKVVGGTEEKKDTRQEEVKVESASSTHPNKGSQTTAAAHSEVQTLLQPPRLNHVELLNRTYRALSPSEQAGANILFTVRTTVKFHKSRLPVLMDTWMTKVNCSNIYFVTDGPDAQTEDKVKSNGKHAIELRHKLACVLCCLYPILLYSL